MELDGTRYPGWLERCASTANEANTMVPLSTIHKYHRSTCGTTYYLPTPELSPPILSEDDFDGEDRPYYSSTTRLFGEGQQRQGAGERRGPTPTLPRTRQCLRSRRGIDRHLCSGHRLPQDLVLLRCGPDNVMSGAQIGVG